LVKFNVFARINTGGMQLSSQELRHALVPGPARILLETWAALPEFLTATGGSVKSARMDDRELVLRYVSFRLTPYTNYRQGDIDGFLIEGMRLLNGLQVDQIDKLEDEFKATMTTASAIFGNDAFRKRYNEGDTRFPINKALFEALSVNLGRLAPGERALLIERGEAVRAGLILLCNDRAFENAISQGTGDIAKVKLRFGMMADMLFRILANVDIAAP